MNSQKNTKPVNPLFNSNLEDFSLEKKISKSDLLDDIRYYIDKIDEVHPDPYRIISKTQFDKQLDEVKQRILNSEKEEFDINECFYYLQEIAAFIQDGHTKIMNPITIISDYFFIRTEKLFPFDIVVYQDRFFVKENWFDTGIPLGSEILSINNKPILEIFKETIKFASGTLNEFKMESWSEQFPSILENYFEMKSPWTIEYKDQKRIKKTIIEGMDWSDEVKKKFIKKRLTFSHYDIQVKEEEIPVLVFPSLNFGLDSSFKTKINDFFAKIRNKKYLVLDMRRNRGGNGVVGLYLLNYLAKEGELVHAHSCFDFKASKTYKKLIKYWVDDFLYDNKIPDNQRNNKIYAELTKDDSDAEFNVRVLEAQNDQVVSKKLENQEKIDNEARFNGKVFFLISSETFSAGVVTAAGFKHNKLGVVVGRETGGRVGFFSDTITIGLPNSNLRANIPSAILNLIGEKLERGIVPDVEVRYNSDDYLNQRDKDLDKVKELITNDFK